MEHKRGLSGVVVTILIITVSIVALTIIALVVMNVMDRGSKQIVLDRFTVNVGIEIATVNYNTGLATVKVKREVGVGDLIGLKFIFEDKKTSEVFDRRFVGFDELEEKTFEMNLTEEDSSLVLLEVEAVSIAPIILLDTGEELIGKISSTVEGLNLGSLGVGGVDPGEEEPDLCYLDSECGIDHSVGERYCSELDIYQYWRTYVCDLGFCRDEMSSVFMKTCSYECIGGICREEQLGCTNETIVEDCGVDGYISLPSCGQTGEQVVREYRTFTCSNEFCESTITQQVIEVCLEGEVCNQGECFIPLECVEHVDCDPGEVCELGVCVPETSLNDGIISSIWPFGIGEYFDSVDLTDPNNESYVGKYILFNTGSQEGCLRIIQHLWPAYPEGYPYVKLNESETNISIGDSYSLFETNYFCSVGAP